MIILKLGIPGTVKTFPQRTGGYLNYQYNNSEPEKNNPEFMKDENEADLLLADINSWLDENFPWMQDFIVFQLSDGTIRLDIADRQFLGGD